MTKKPAAEDKSQSKTGSLNGSKKSNGKHALNVPMDESQMSESDKATLRAWKYAFKNREKRVD